MNSELRTYQPRLSRLWWLRNRRYLLFVLRDLSPLPIVIWLFILLWQVSQARVDTGSLATPWFVAFSVVCLAFALLHSITWLSLSGVILRVPLGERDVSPRLITAANFALWIGATIVIGALLILLGQ